MLAEQEKDKGLYIYIHREWDYAPHVSEEEVPKTYHVKRTAERQIIIDFLSRREEGALLLSGKRGVGKSSLVFDAIHKVANKMSSKEKYALPVLVNAPNFEIRRVNEKGEKLNAVDILEFKRVVLQNLVRRLFHSTRNIPIEGDKIKVNKDTKKIMYDEGLFLEDDFSQALLKKNLSIGMRSKDSITSLAVHTKISELFKRAVAREVRKETNIEELEKEQNRIETKSRIELSIAEKLAGIAASLTSAGVIAVTNPFLNTQVTAFVSLAIAIAPSAVITISWERTKNRLAEQSQQKSASVYYHHDYDVSTLQSELEDKLRKLSNLRCKVVFVIDELDKMEDPDEVINVIKSLKGLFNQAAALFILISGEEFYKKLVNRRDNRPTEYTLFPQKIFLQRPDFEDMHTFIDKILRKPTFSDLETNVQFKNMREAYHKFRNYACFSSKTDYFDLYNILRNHISFEDDDLKLDIVIDRKLETVANLQTALENIYNRKKLARQSDWYKNDLLLDSMYGLLTRLVERKANEAYFRIQLEPFNIVFLDKNLTVLGDNEDTKNNNIHDDADNNETIEGNDKNNNKRLYTEMEREAITDLINYLVRLNFLSVEGDNYKIGGILENVPSEIKTLTKEENDFVDQYNKLRYLLIVYANLHNRYMV